MLPRLQAEERLNAITDGAISAGSMPRDEQTDVIERLRKAAAIERAKPAKANIAGLAAMGIAVSGLSPPAEDGLSDG